MPDPTIAYRTVAWVYPPNAPAISCPVELLFSSSEPYSVSLAFAPDIKGAVTWTFGRDLLRASVSSAQDVGTGDVTFRRLSTERLMGSLDSPYGKCKFSLPLKSVETFLRSTECVVPYGEESAAYEALIEAGLAEFLKQGE